MSIIVYTIISSKYISIAAPHLKKCIPISSRWNSNLCSLIDIAAALIIVLTASLFISNNFPEQYTFLHEYLIYFQDNLKFSA